MPRVDQAAELQECMRLERSYVIMPPRSAMSAVSIDRLRFLLENSHNR
jgi:hypothetical protein